MTKQDTNAVIAVDNQYMELRWNTACATFQVNKGAKRGSFPARFLHFDGRDNLNTDVYAIAEHEGQISLTAHGHSILVPRYLWDKFVKESWGYVA